MNAAENFKNKCEELENRFYAQTREELLNKAALRHFMELLCHCSGEIDKNTLLYFSVHNMFLGNGEYVLLIFSEHGRKERESDTTSDRIFTYTIIEEEVRKVLDRHYCYYCCEMDGRLAVLILYQYVLPEETDQKRVSFIQEGCEIISKLCLHEYGLHVCAYMSENIKNLSVLSDKYKELLSKLEYDQFMHHFPDPLFYLQPHPDSRRDAPPLHPYELLQPHIKELANALVCHDNYSPVLDKVLDIFTSVPCRSIAEMRIQYKDFMEGLLDEMILRGIRLDRSALQAKIIHAGINSVSWVDLSGSIRDIVAYLYSISKVARQSHTVLRYQEASEYIAEHLNDESLSVNKVAAEIQIPPQNLIAMFQKNLHTTPAQYIRTLRLKNAMQLLKTTDKPIPEIVTECGFGSIETFYRLFKSEFGITPAKCRHLSVLNPPSVKTFDKKPEEPGRNNDSESIRNRSGSS